MKLPQGFRYSAVYAGIRKLAKPDLALILSDTEAAAAGVFTTNLVQAAPVRLTRRNLAVTGGRARAVLVNAGNQGVRKTEHIPELGKTGNIYFDIARMDGVPASALAALKAVWLRQAIRLAAKARGGLAAAVWALVQQIS